MLCSPHRLHSQNDLRVFYLFSFSIERSLSIQDHGKPAKLQEGASSNIRFPTSRSLVTGQKSSLGQENTVAGRVQQVVASLSAYMNVRLSVPGEVVCSTSLVASHGGL